MSVADTIAESRILTGPAPDVGPREAWLVLGMHRSGTSAMARVLELSGGQGPLDPLPPSPANPLGYAESASIMALNDEILAKGDTAWDDVFSGRPRPYLSGFDQALRRRAAETVQRSFPGEEPIVLKDPRINVLGAFWDAALRAHDLRPCYIIMVRHPMEVAGSLLARDRLPIEHGLLLWLDHMLAAERDTRGAQRAFVSYEALLQDWRGVLDDVERSWGQPFPRRTGLAGAQIASFIRPALRHQHAGRDLPPFRGPLGAMVSQAYDWFTSATRPQPPAHRDALDRASAWLDGLHDQFEPVIAYQKLRSADVQAELGRYMAHTRALEGVQEGLKAELAQAQAGREAQAAELAPLRSELETRAQALAGELDASRGERDALRARLAAQVGELDHARASLVVRDADMLQIRALLDARTLELQHARSALDTRSAELAQGQATLAARLGELAAVGARNDATTAEASRMRDAERDAHLQRIRQLEEESHRLTAERDALRRSGETVDTLYNESLRTLRTDFQKQLSDLATLPASFEEELQASEARYGALSDEMRRIQALSEAAHAQRQELERELAQTRQAMADAVTADLGRAAVDDQLTAARDSLAAETALRAQAEARAQEQDVQLTALRSSIAAAQEDIGALRREREGILNSRAWRLATASHRWLTRRTA